MQSEHNWLPVGCRARERDEKSAGALRQEVYTGMGIWAILPCMKEACDTCRALQGCRGPNDATMDALHNLKQQMQVGVGRGQKQKLKNGRIKKGILVH